jgi:hypothetical protein
MLLALVFRYLKSAHTSSLLSLRGNDVCNLGLQANTKLLVPIPHPSLKVCASKAHIHMTQSYPIEDFGLVLEPLHGDVIDRGFEQFLTGRDIFGKNATSEGNLS